MRASAMRAISVNLRRSLRTRFAQAARTEPQPELHLHVDKTTQYQIVAAVMASAAKAGLTRIGFIADPREQP